MSEKRILAVIKEPRTFSGSDGKEIKAFDVVFKDGSEATTYSEKMVEALREHLDKEIEVEIQDTGKEFQGKKQYKLVSAPGIFEPKSGGGRQWQPRDYVAEQKARNPSMALAYAKDLAVAGKLTAPDPKHIIEAANDFLGWLESKLGAAQSAPKPEQKPGPSAPKESSWGEPSATPSQTDNGGMTAEERAEAIPLRGKIKRLDPHRFADVDLTQYTLADLRQLHDELTAAQG